MRTLRAFTTLCCAVLFFGVLACSDSGDVADGLVAEDLPVDTGLDVLVPDNGPDAAPDAAVDTAPDAAVDTAPDTAVDAEPDLPTDTAPDTAVDTAPDTAPDADPDTVQPPDNLTCLGSVEWPEPAAATYTHTYGLVELLMQEPVVGATAKVCELTDPDCAAPLSTGTTDENGNVTLTFPAAAEGLNGYVEFSGAGIVTTLGFFRYTDNVTAYTSPGAFVYYVLGTNTLVALAGMSNVEPDITRGHVIFSAQDCNGDAAAGIYAEIMSADAGTVAVYTEGGMPNTDLTATTADGQGGLLNVPPGSAMLSGFDQATGLELGSAEVIVRAGAVTSALLVPMPLWEQ